jgi:hypothetical protein
MFWLISDNFHLEEGEQPLTPIAFKFFTRSIHDAGCPHNGTASSSHNVEHLSNRTTCGHDVFTGKYLLASLDLEPTPELKNPIRTLSKD